MITLQDCFDMCDMPEDVVVAVAEHEHLPCILAAELCRSLAGSADGLGRIYGCVADTIDQARAKRDERRCRRFEQALSELCAAYPELARPAQRLN